MAAVTWAFLRLITYLGVEMTHFGEYFKLLERLDGSLEPTSARALSEKELEARLLELGYIVRHDERLEPWQRTVLLEQLFLLQRPAPKPKLAYDA